MNEREIFAEAMQKSSARERAEYLAEACGNDQPLRQRIEELVAEQERLGSFLELPATGVVQVAAATMDAEPTQRLGSQIGPYKLLQVIGEGGMGVVYMAEQHQPVMRRVALKIIKPGMDTRQVIARFEAERQALAMMDHPNIAKVLDAGATPTGRPYFVMELVKGVPITQYCDQQHLTPRQRLELFIPVCQAIQHAHQKGIIHRDLKPSNVLVALYDGRPVAKVIDFGVAKATSQRLTEKTMFTEFGQIVGTLEYMSPEQAELSQLDIDTRSDIYSLGVMLYELLTGTTPFDKQRLRSAAFHEILRMIREEEPPRPSTRLSTTDQLPSIAANRGTPPAKLSGLMRGELDWIVMKSLEKDRTRRYETATGLARDIERYLHDEPVQACPPSAAYQLSKYLRRHRGLVAAASIILIALLLGAIGTTAGLVRAAWERSERKTATKNAATSDRLAKAATKAEGEAKAALTRAVAAERDLQIASHLSRARAYRTSGQPGQRFKCLEELAQAARRNPQRKVRKELRDEAIAALALADLRPVVLDQNDPTTPDGIDRQFRHLARVGKDNILRVLRVSDQSEVARIELSRALVKNSSVEFSPDGKHLFMSEVGSDGAVLTVDRELPSGREIHAYEGALCRLSSDGRRCATSVTRSEGGSTATAIVIHDIGSRSVEKEIALGPPRGGLVVDPQLRFASQGAGTLIRIWDLAAGTVVHEINEPDKANLLGWDESGRYLMYATNLLGQVKVWDIPGRKLHRTTDGTRNPGGLARMSPRGDLLVSSGYNNLHLWDATSGTRILTVPGIWGVMEFSADGGMVGPARDQNRLVAWEVSEGFAARRSFTQSTSTYQNQPRIGLDPRGLLLVTAGQIRGVRIWNRRTGEPLADLPDGIRAPRFDPVDGSLLTAGDRGLHRWPVVVEQRTSGTQSTTQVRIGPPQSLGITDPLVQFDMTPDGDRAVCTCYANNGVMVVDLRHPEKHIAIRTGMNVRSAISGDGRWAITGPSGPQVATVAWDALTGAKVKSWGASEVPVSSIAVDASDDGEWVATSSNVSLKLWKAGTWEAGPTIPLDQATYGSYPGIFGFSPDNCLIAYAKSNLTIALFDRSTGEELALLPLEGPHPMSGVNLWFTPGGSELAVGRENMTATVWNLRALREELATIGLDWEGPAYAAARPLPAGAVEVVVDSGGLDFSPYPQTGTPEQKLASINEWIKREPELLDLYYRRGVVLASLKQFEAATADLENYLRAHPQDAPALSLQARVLAQLGQHDASRQALETLLALEPPSNTADVLAFACYELGDYYAREEALRDWHQVYRLAKRAAALAPVSFNQTLLGRAAYREGHYQEAIDTLQKNLAPGAATYYLFHDRFIKAMAQKKLGHEAEATATLESALARFEQVYATLNSEQVRSAHVWRDEALALFGRNVPIPATVATPPAGATTKEIIDFYSQAIARDAADLHALRGRAAALWQNQDYQAALADYEAAIGLAPSDAELRYFAAKTQMQQNQVPQSIENARKLLGAQPGVYTENQLGLWCSQLALGYAYRGDRSEQRELIGALGGRAIELAPSQFLTHYNVALAYGRLEQWDDASRRLERALELQPTGSTWPCQIWKELVRAERGRRNRRAAQAYVDKIKAWGTEHEASLPADQRESFRQILSQADGEMRLPFWSVPAKATPQEIVDYLSPIIVNDPADVEALLQRGDAHRRLGNHDAALADLNAVVKLQPEGVMALLSIAQVELGRNRLEEAMQAVKALLAIDPVEAASTLEPSGSKFSNAEVYVVNSLFNTRKPEAQDLAVELAERGPALLPNSWYLRNFLAETYSRVERWDDAAREFEASIPGATASNQPYIPWSNLVITEHHRGNRAKAQEYLETFRKWKAENEGKPNSWTPANIDALQKRTEDLLNQPPGEPQKP